MGQIFDCILIIKIKLVLIGGKLRDFVLSFDSVIKYQKLARKIAVEIPSISSQIKMFQYFQSAFIGDFENFIVENQHFV